MSTPYNTEFFAGQSARSLASARVVLGALFAAFQPERVIDVGCGVGSWLRAARDLGATEILGVDGDYVDRAALLVKSTEFLPVDLEQQRLCDVAPLADARRFDLVISVEVAEHLSFERAESFVNDLTWLGDVVLFSAGVPFQGGEQHLNEQWPEFWALLFRARGFDCLDSVRPLIWARDDVDWWYAQNTLLFVRRGSAAAERLRQPVQPAIPPLSFVHPNNYLAQILKWFHTHRLAAAEEEEADLASLVAAYLAGASRVPPLRAIARAKAAPERPDVFPNTRIERFFPEPLMREQQDRLAALERDCDEARQSREQLAAANSGLIMANAELAAVAAGAREQHAALLTRHADLATEHDILESAYATLREGYRTQQDEVAALRAATGEWQALREDLTLQLAELRDELQRFGIADAEGKGLARRTRKPACRSARGDWPAPQRRHPGASPRWKDHGQPASHNTTTAGLRCRSWGCRCACCVGRRDGPCSG